MGIIGIILHSLYQYKLKMFFQAVIILIIISSSSIQQSKGNGIFKHCLKTTFDHETETEIYYRAWGLIKPLIYVDKSIINKNNNNRTLMFCPDFGHPTTIMPTKYPTTQPIQCQTPEPCQSPTPIPTQSPETAATTTMMTCECPICPPMPIPSTTAAATIEMTSDCPTKTIPSTTPATTEMATTTILSECPPANTYIGNFIFWICSALSGVLIQWIIIICVNRRWERRQRFAVRMEREEPHPQPVQIVSPAEISDLFARLAQLPPPPPPPSPGVESNGTVGSFSTIIDNNRAESSVSINLDEKDDDSISIYENENPRDARDLLREGETASISIYHDV